MAADPAEFGPLHPLLGPATLRLARSAKTEYLRYCFLASRYSRQWTVPRPPESRRAHGRSPRGIQRRLYRLIRCRFASPEHAAVQWRIFSAARVVAQGGERAGFGRY